MEKRRVYQVAKEQKLSSDALISTLKGLEFEVKSHMSVVTDEMLEAIVRKIDEEKKSSVEEVKRQKVKEKSRKQAEQAQAAKRVEEKSKARKKRAPSSPPPATVEKGIPLPQKEEEGGRKRSRRQGKPRETAPTDTREELLEKKEVTVRADRGATGPAAGGAGRGAGRGAAGGAAGGRRRGKRRRGVDTRAVQENVRKTLTQINEGRTRRRYERGAKEEGAEASTEETQTIRIGEFATLAEFAEELGVRSNEVIVACLQMGVMATINQRLDMDTMATVGLEFGYNIEPLDTEEVEVEEEFEEEEEVGEVVPRPPVVTVMGHVDHGKTSLLDYLRETNVAEGESGGITQHIGAYVVKMPDGRAVTFLDTPGHAAFTAMRARGSRVTDLVILVVAADDSVMPQTIEAIDHAKAAQVPLVVAINKTDLPTADPDRIKRELSERGVLVEDWGGQVSCADISAKTGAGIDKLLEVLLIEAELLELKANPDRRVRGTIIEAKLDKGRGPVATILVQEGTLRVGEPFITGVFNSRVRALMDEHGQRVEEAGPSTPVEVLGLPGVPQAGDPFVVTASEREAKEIGQRRQQVKREQEARRIRTVTLSDLHHQIQQGRIQELKVIIKGDVDGSVEAIAQELGGITHEEVRVAVIHSGVGAISESDVLLASASNAIIIAFRVSLEASARETAVRNAVEIRQYKVIYEVIEEIRAALSGLLAPTRDENVIGAAQVRQVFSSSNFGTIAGCMIQKGTITRNNKVRVMRNGEVVFKGELSSLKRFKDDVREVAEGFECGIGLQGFDEIQEEDVIEALEVVETARSL